MGIATIIVSIFLFTIAGILIKKKEQKSIRIILLVLAILTLGMGIYEIISSAQDASEEVFDDDLK